MSLKDKPSMPDESDAATVALPTRGVTPDGTPAPQTHPSQALPTSSLTGSQQLVGGRYEIVRLVGVGGMGSVYQARDAELEEIVALKTLRRELLEDADMLDRFRNEVKLARRVTHRNVARMYDIGEHGGEKFLTMEFVDGESLAAVLAREQRLSTGRIVELATAVCAGLGAAHAAGVIHRDLKPDNVMIAKDGRVLVTDFGIARASLDAGNKTVGMVLGTPAYMAPEQVLGLKDLDGRVDIYALGAMLFELFTGEDAWTGESPMAIATARLLTPQPPDPRAKRSDVPDAAARVVMKCMAKERADRYATAEQVAADLAALTMPSMQAVPVTLVRHETDPALQVPGSSDKTVAVLPFRNAGPPDDEYLAEGLTDDLIDTLSMTRGLRVCSRGSVAKFKGVAQDPRSVGAELAVQVVVEGSVRKTPGAVRITARLVSVADGFQLWAKRFDRPDKDLLAINDEAARAIAEALTVNPTAPARESPSDALAIDLYLRARNEYHKIWPDCVARSVEIFEQALARAPNDPTILSGYAMARARYNFFVGEDNERAMTAAKRAVDAAPNLPEARLALATVLFQSGDALSAVHELKVALTKGPGLAEAQWLLGRILGEVGHADDAVRHLEVALTLDPSLGLARRDLTRIYALTGRWEKSYQLIDVDASELPDVAPWIERARMTLWRRDKARAEAYLQAMPKSGERVLVARKLLSVVATGTTTDPFADVQPTAATMQSPARGSGRRHTFFAQIEAEIAAYNGDTARAIDAIRRAIDAGLIDLLWFDRCPLFSAMGGDIRFITQRARLEARTAPIIEAYSGLRHQGR